jgi:glucose-6-phosphate 1-dehydrogenase
MNKQPGPDAPSIVIFGASGDLTRRKLVPALYRLYAKERLPASFRIAGFARTEMDDDGFRELMRENTAEHSPSFDEETWEMFAQNLYYVVGAYDDEAALHRLEERLAELEPDGAGRLYHLSVPPSVYPTIVASLGRAGMAHNEEGWCRVIVEKPFGEDLESARALNRRLHEVLDEEQIYRIDHYLGKETVQNLLVFRFANAIFEPIWNRNYISHVQITAAEEGDVGHRGSFYDATGILRDMFQNHLLQLLALVAMEPPASFQADALRNEKAKVLSALQQSGERSLAQNSVRGQYEGYRKAEGVAGDSETATFAALRLYLDNWRWQGVPFYLRSGKALARKTTEIVVHFWQPPQLLFGGDGQEAGANYIALCIQPDEGIHLRFAAKVPDTVADMEPVDMEFHYADNFQGKDIPDAYERLLLDALNGDAALFTRADEIELAWKFIDRVRQSWKGEHAPPLQTYARGSWGPAAATELISAHCRGWTSGCSDHAE